MWSTVRLGPSKTWILPVQTLVAATNSFASVQARTLAKSMSSFSASRRGLMSSGLNS